MLAVRRLYIYAVTFAAQWMVLTGMANLARVLVELVLGLVAPPSFVTSPEDFRQRVSLFGALLLVGTPIWAGHWWAANRAARGEDAAAVDERRSLVRQLYLYASVLIAAGIVAFQTQAALRDLLASALDLPGPRGLVLLTTVLGRLFWALAAAVLWTYLWRRGQHDRLHSGERPGGAVARRLAVLTAAFIALLLMAVAAANLLWLAWRALTEPRPIAELDTPWWSAALAQHAPTVLVWAVAWTGHWRIAEGWLADPALQAHERHATVRRLYLYLTLFVAVAVTLTNLSRLLYGFFLAALGEAQPGGQPVLLGAGRPLSWVVVFLPLWWYHRWVLRRDAAALPLGEAQAGLRRLYVYLVAALSLALLATGLALALSALVDIAARGLTLRDTALRAKVSFAATSILVGLPVWAWHWGTAQRLAADATGWLERRALSRRVYLYLVLFAAVVAVLSAGAAVLYQVLQALLGAPADLAFWRVLGAELGAVVAALATLAYHVPVLRRDLRTTSAPPASQAAGVRLLVTVEVPASIDRADLMERLATVLPPGGRVVAVTAAPGADEG